MQLQVKTILNAVQHFPGFVFQDMRLRRYRDGQPRHIEIVVEPHGGISAKCSRCRQPAPGYDQLPQRSWLFVPLWGLMTWFLYAARRVDCPEHGVVVEHVPWSDGKRPVTMARMCFLSRWARRLSWRETARAFGTSWECVYRSVEWFVAWGLAHRKLVNVRSLVVDEIHWGRSKGADHFLTVIYQIDGHCRRLLWVGQRRTQATLRRGLTALGDEVVSGLRFVCSDMWRPYLNVIAARAGDMVQLLWRGPGDSFAVIPKTQLYSRVNPAPTVTFVNPANEARFAASASVTVGVEAQSTFNQITGVEFFANGKSLGRLVQSVYAPTYAVTATGLAEGRYTLIAVATDGSGLTSTSAPVNITVAVGSGLPYGLSNREKVAPFLKMPATFSDAVPPLLSGTGVFSDTASRTPSAGLIPYRLNVPMWSDGAMESDFMAVPNRGDNITPDEQLRLRPAGFWKFPDGTVFIKNLDLVVDEIHPNAPLRRLETQVLVRDNNGAVYGATYKWRQDNRDADLVTAGLSEDIAVTNANGIIKQTWYYASPADCLTCHSPGAGYVLGVNTRQLNGDFTYPATANTDNQIRTLNRLGLFSPAIDETKIAGFAKLAPLTDLNASLADRARSYLDVNCAHCHRPGGVGNYDARYDTPQADQNIINVPAAVTLGLNDARIVKASDTDHSVLYQRLTSVVPTVKMPPLAHNRVDVRAARLMREWINSIQIKPNE